MVVNPASGQNESILNTLNDVFHPAGVTWSASVTRAYGDAINEGTVTTWAPSWPTHAPFVAPKPGSRPIRIGLRCASVSYSILLSLFRYGTSDRPRHKKSASLHGLGPAASRLQLSQGDARCRYNALRQPIDRYEALARSQEPLSTEEDLGSRRTLLLRRRAPLLARAPQRMTSSPGSGTTTCLTPRSVKASAAARLADSSPWTTKRLCRVRGPSSLT